MIDDLLKESVQAFIVQNETSDPFELTLKQKEVSGVPIALISQQISARQTAKKKFPAWYATERLVYPPRLSLEQSSSQVTAEYKASLFKGESFIDLTGGMGVDAWAFSKSFQSATYIEKQEQLSNLAKHNFDRLGLPKLEVVNTTAEAFLEHESTDFDLIYIDPARRDKNTNKVFRLVDCTPNVLELLPILLKRAEQLLVKTSPMMDIEQALQELSYVKEVHILSVESECKEVLYLLSEKEPSTPLNIRTINFTKGAIQEFEFEKESEKNVESTFSAPSTYLYEPNSAIMKSGGYKLIGTRYELSKLHVHTHLYTSDKYLENFPGRVFQIIGQTTFDKKSIKKIIPDGKANVATRNFLVDVKTVKKRLGLKDGGSYYLFACTDLYNKPTMLLCIKVSRSQ